jgi:glycosyltransferase involved in cell wall biosynthesis
MEMEEPKSVSFVVPTFHRPESLRATLDALMGLDFPRERYEVIVVDDGANQATRDLVEGFSGGSPRVVYLRQDHLGVATARNRGAAAADLPR